MSEHQYGCAHPPGRGHGRRRAFRRGSVLAALAVVLAGCATPPITIPPHEQPGALPGALAQFADTATPSVERDPAVTVEGGAVESAYGCTVRYEYYEPAASASGPDTVEPDTGAPIQRGLVVLGHGFMRDLSTMRGWAAEWAARGTPTVVVSFCNSSWFNGHHARNGDDLVAVAGLLRPAETPVMYAGFSAGGLSALLAAEQDERAIGYLGLDPVDSGELASSVDQLHMPALFLYGAPSACNAENNMVDVMPHARRRIALRIPYASHCSFENPYDPACAGFCGAVEPEEQAREIRRTIHVLATAWVEAQMGATPDSRAVYHRRTLEELERAHRVELLDPQ